jgi:putative endonuclease
MADICCYIIYSERLQKFYTGLCQELLVERINKHNNHDYGLNSYTSAANDWQLVLKIEVETVSHARRLELKIKSMKSSVYIRNLIKYPEMIEKIIQETK